MRRALAAAVVALALAAPAARADEQIEAGPGTRYLTTSPSIDQGERLTFTNLDTTGHDVTARKLGADGRPLFQTPVIGTGSSSFVVGSQYLTTGRYDFYCSVHPFMQGTLTVTSAGRPAPRPARQDTRAPGVAIEIVSSRLGKVKRSGKLRVSFHTDERATVRLRGSVRAGGRTYALSRTARSVRANRPATVELQLSDAARSALGRVSKALFKVYAATRDAAGNRGTGAARRTLKR